MKTQNLIQIICFLSLTLLLACGEGKVSLDGAEYQPRIVIEGTIFPGTGVQNIRISRNFPLDGGSIDNDDILIPDADVTIFDESQTAFALTFNRTDGTYESTGPDLQIEYGKSYTLEVSATIDGQQLSARSTTTVPQPGFKILESESLLGARGYRERDENGALINFQTTFERSPNTDFYALSLTALDADIATFIYDNPFCDCTEEDVEDDFNDFRLSYDWIQDTPLEPGKSTIEIFSFFTWFYGDYQAVVYAADKNFKDFVLTHEQVQEIDGNFHEPAFHIEGDGIGVFGSAIADTAFFRILQN